MITSSEQITNRKKRLSWFTDHYDTFAHLVLRKNTYLVSISNDTTAITSSYLLNTSLDGYHYISLLRGCYVLSIHLLHFLLKLLKVVSVLSDIRTAYLSNTDLKRKQHGVLVVRNPDSYSR